MGTIITFYSYKGGVGRTFTLANTAARLSQWGFRVLCVDWDLDAPGLGFYFTKWQRRRPSGGILDIVGDLAEGRDGAPHRYLIPIQLPEQKGHLDYLAAGAGDDEYVQTLHTVDWARLYEEKGFGDAIEDLRNRWKATYDFVLVDSRTGITDIGGICTVQIPDILVMLFTPNEQSLQGTLSVARRAVAAQNTLPYDRAGLLVMPVATRFDSREEYDRASLWQRRLVTDLAPLFRAWAPADVPIERLIGHLTVPYVSYWSFGEELPAVIERDPAPDKIGYSLDAIAAIIAHRLRGVDLLADSRGGYVAAASRSALRTGAKIFDVFLSFESDESGIAARLSAALEERDVSVYSATPAHTGARSSEDREDALARSRCMVAIIGANPERYQTSEISRYLRQSLEDESTFQIIPVLAPGVARADAPRILLQFQMEEMHGADSVADIAVRIAAAVKIPNLERQLAELTDTYGPDSSRVLTARSDLIDAYLDTQRFGESVPLLESFVDDTARILGPDHIETLVARVRLGSAYFASGKTTIALRVLEHAVTDMDRVLDRGNPNLMFARSTLAYRLLEFGRVTEASALFEILLADAEHFLGVDSAETVSARGFLAYAYEYAGRHEDAVPLREQVVRDSDRVLGRENIRTITARRDLARVYRAVGRTADAVLALETAVTSAERVFGPESAETLALRTDLGEEYLRSGWWEEAESLLGNIVREAERLLGANDAVTLRAQAGLGAAFQPAGRLDESTALLEPAVRGLERALGPDHPTTLSARADLAVTYRESGHLEQAVPLLERSLADFARVLGPDHPETLIAIADLARAYVSAGRSAAAMSLIDNATPPFERVLGEHHPVTVWAHILRETTGPQRHPTIDPDPRTR